MDGETEEYIPEVPSQSTDQPVDHSPSPVTSKPLLTGSHTHRLEDLAYTRSGDKGNNSNIGR